ncbi:hypothetical protein BDP55DRAFT_669520 [Colletotrichum godetiae]|uniref:Uncharacterized protein n=1 Tax=Colletotrichum godetiae TaxID=1209918 RepID=A0AAJ0AJD5_9PEZI|nr:uncharacterized protein BDP55DRAFT_669520 [Colletotrichum godetiae]KAK1673528.1 hypothetical protein BDP55DRAFT_669520 [Colletotrichum godetiae]
MLHPPFPSNVAHQSIAFGSHFSFFLLSSFLCILFPASTTISQPTTRFFLPFDHKHTRNLFASFVLNSDLTLGLVTVEPTRILKLCQNLPKIHTT